MIGADVVHPPVVAKLYVFLAFCVIDTLYEGRGADDNHVWRREIQPRRLYSFNMRKGLVGVLYENLVQRIYLYLYISIYRKAFVPLQQRGNVS